MEMARTDRLLTFPLDQREGPIKNLQHFVTWTFNFAESTILFDKKGNSSIHGRLGLSIC
jgi:hypothetical protein